MGGVANDGEGSARAGAICGLLRAACGDLRKDGVGGSATGQWGEHLSADRKIRLALLSETMFMFEFERQGDLGGDGFRRIARQGGLFSACGRQEHAAQMIFGADRSPQRVAQAHQRADHGTVRKSGRRILEVLVDALAGIEQLLRHRRLERQPLPIRGRFSLVRLPDDPAKTCRRERISGLRKIRLQPHADPVRAAFAGESVDRFAHQLCAGRSREAGSCRALPAVFLLFFFSPGPHLVELLLEAVPERTKAWLAAHVHAFSEFAPCTERTN